MSEGAPPLCLAPAWWLRAGVVSGVFPRRRVVAVPGCRRLGVPISVRAGVGVVCESVVACGARPRAGEGGRKGVRGKPGETPGFGGVAPGFPRDACRLPRAAGARAARSAAPWAHFPGDLLRRKHSGLGLSHR